MGFLLLASRCLGTLHARVVWSCLSGEEGQHCNSACLLASVAVSIFVTSLTTHWTCSLTSPGAVWKEKGSRLGNLRIRFLHLTACPCLLRSALGFGAHTLR